jgi:hypothetical protein
MEGHVLSKVELAGFYQLKNDNQRKGNTKSFRQGSTPNVPQGKITQSLYEPIGKHLKIITSARGYCGYLYLGSLHNDRIGKYKIA